MQFLQLGQRGLSRAIWNSHAEADLLMAVDGYPRISDLRPSAPLPVG